jgi:hypothetical protein
MIALILAMLLSLPAPMRDRALGMPELRNAQMEAFAVEISKVSKGAPLPPRDWAALIVTVGNHETHFETRLVAGNCFWEKRECDATMSHGERIFRARGAFQNHRNTNNVQWWEAANGNIPAQVQMVNDGLRRGWNTCRTSGVTVAAGALRGYAGSSCTKPMRGEGERLQTFERLRRVVAPVVLPANDDSQKQAG